MTDKDLRAKYLNQVRVLLDMAERPTTPPGEADAARAKAEALMRKYRVEEEAKIAADPQTLAPVTEQMDVTESDEFASHYATLLEWAARHVGIRVRSTYAWDGTKYLVKATVVGYESDIRMAELLFTNARMAFGEHLEPKPDPSASDQENCYRMRRAGLERNRIANQLWGSAFNDGPAHGKVAKLYKAECAARGETAALSGRGVNAKLYRKNYADGFLNRFHARLRRVRDAADRIGGLPALHGREERVAEAFYALYPDARPVPAGAVAPTEKGKRAPKPYRLTKADIRRWERAERPEAQAARAAGRSAADSVALDGSAPSRRLDDRTPDERETTRVVRGALG
jgi:hypothetical protein